VFSAAPTHTTGQSDHWLIPLPVAAAGQAKRVGMGPFRLPTEVSARRPRCHAHQSDQSV